MEFESLTNLDVERVGKVEYVCSLLKEMIFRWELKPGQKINIRQLSKEMNVSAIPMREALNRLHTEHLLILEQNKGYRVSDILDEKKMKDLFEARILIETEAVRNVIRSNQLGLLAEMIKATDMMSYIDATKSYKEVLKFVQLDQQFHNHLIEAGGNSFLIEAYRGMQSHLHIARFYHVRGEVDQKEAVSEHREIISAIQMRDIYKAEIAVSSHILDVKNRFGF